MLLDVASAQDEGAPTETVAQSFIELTRVLKVGQKVVVTDERGEEVKGRVAELSESSLVVLGPQKRTFTEAGTSKVRRTDSSWNGTLIGLGVGAAIAGAGMKASQSSGGESGYGWWFVGSWLLPTVGAITGYVADKQTGNDPIYLSRSRAGPLSVSVSPFVSKVGIGISASLRF